MDILHEINRLCINLKILYHRPPPAPPPGPPLCRTKISFLITFTFRITKVWTLKPPPAPPRCVKSFPKETNFKRIQPLGKICYCIKTEKLNTLPLWSPNRKLFIFLFLPSCILSFHDLLADPPWNMRTISLTLLIQKIKGTWLFSSKVLL